jgi:hypothetical protein
MNNENLVNEIVSSLVSKIADAAVASIEEKINLIIDEKLTKVPYTSAYDVDQMFDKFVTSDRFTAAVTDAIDIDDIVSDVDIESQVRDVIDNLTFDVSVR